ncbi:UDP-glucose 4-epimerase GalE [Methylocystis parvus]|uniref:UDP-glucose 4-epimerase n=1 Tax=Methylocystis parvus TaxID=134 RepID=A0A6B8M4H8_9HYPH|nr:UDP-glucose 4-epimerase GalE [Methylocystis parvus]QGM96669.1 UDP-glucose 4-epimerase GalE [Methylocystis parvus]WBJ99469.1 UDP-glucose 4-epimerase GalE [Methylocystis parvus OBBP]
MAVLVTGGAGYIGSHTVLELLDAGEKPVVLDDLSTGFRWAVPEGVPLVVGDDSDEDLVTETIGRYAVDAIIHFAAKIVVPDSVADPLGYYLNNTAKARTLIATAIGCDVKHFIFSSTAAVYGDPDHLPVTEDEPLKPVSPYGRSKLMVEWMLEDAARAYDFAYVALRYFNVAGADPKGRSGQSTPNATHLIKVAAQTALGKRPKMQVFGTDYPTPDGACVRDYIQVTDLACAHIDALRHLRGGGESLVANCGYARGFSVLEVIEAVKRISGVDFKVEYVPRRPGDPAAIVASNERARNILGWKPQHDNLDEIVRQALDWEKRLGEKV